MHFVVYNIIYTLSAVKGNAIIFTWCENISRRKRLRDISTLKFNITAYISFNAVNNFFITTRSPLICPILATFSIYYHNSMQLLPCGSIRFAVSCQSHAVTGLAHNEWGVTCQCSSIARNKWCKCCVNLIRDISFNF